MMAGMMTLTARSMSSEGLFRRSNVTNREVVAAAMGRGSSQFRFGGAQDLGKTKGNLGLGLGFGCGGRVAGRFGSRKIAARAGVEKVGFGDGGNRGGGLGSSGGGGGGGGDEGLGGNSPDDSSQGFGASLWIWYNGLLERHPLIAKSLTAAFLNAVADYFCQVFVEKLEKVDWKRFFSFVAIGLCLSGPGLHYWYGALPKIIPLPGPAGVLLRIALDQVIFTPLGMVSFFVVLLTLENRQEDIKRKLEKDWWPTVVANWKVWIPFQIVNFGLVPPQLQVAAAGLLGTVWSVFISYKGHT